MTLSWPRLRRWRARRASPCRFRISATSRRDRATMGAAVYGGGGGGQQRERTGDLADRLQGHPGIEGGGVELAMPEQHLDDADVGLALQEVGGEAVPQGVHGDAL